MSNRYCFNLLLLCIYACNVNAPSYITAIFARLYLHAANLPDEVVEQVPAEIKNGVYFGWASVDSGTPHKAVMSLGWSPFYKNTKRTLVSMLYNLVFILTPLSELVNEINATILYTTAALFICRKSIYCTRSIRTFTDHSSRSCCANLYERKPTFPHWVSQCLWRVAIKNNAAP